MKKIFPVLLALIFSPSCVTDEKEEKGIENRVGDGPIEVEELDDNAKRIVGHWDEITSMVFTPDGTKLVSGSVDMTIRVWDVATGTELARLSGHTQAVAALSISSDGTKLLSGSHDMTVRLWDLNTGLELRRMLGHTRFISAVAFSKDSLRAVSGSFDKTIKIWDLDSGTEIKTLLGHSASVTNLSFSPDGRFILSASEDKTVRLWNPTTGRQIRRFLGHSQWVTSTAFSKDGSKIITGGFDKTVRVWQTLTGKELRKISTSYPISTVMFSPSGRALSFATGELGEALLDTKKEQIKIQVVDVKSGSELNDFSGHEGVIAALKFQEDKIISAGFDETIRVWDLQ